MDLLEHRKKKACNSVVECLPHEQHCRWFDPNQAYIFEKPLLCAKVVKKGQLAVFRPLVCFTKSIRLYGAGLGLY